MAKTVDSPASTTIGTYRFIFLSPPCQSRSPLSRRGHLRQRVEHAIDRVAAPGLGEVTEQLHGEAHDVGPLDPVPGGEPHERGMADRLHKGIPQCVVAAVSDLEFLGIALQ